jgi:hypothetical protein
MSWFSNIFSRSKKPKKYVVETTRVLCNSDRVVMRKDETSKWTDELPDNKTNTLWRITLEEIDERGN